MVGAAKQEKLLEERHRQRELEKKTSEFEAESDTDPNRDSRFDDFDEDDFDYEAMMADDGLEEPIPGAGFDDYGEEEIPMNDMGYDEEEIPMNSLDYDEEEVPMNSMDYDEEEVPMNSMDYDDEEIPTKSMDYDEEAPEDLSAKVQGLRLSQGPEAGTDPDDDQENFAGFVFQRSNPTSELTTPRSAGLLITPRDADGRVIGFATSGDGLDAHPTEAHPLSQDSLHQIDFQDEVAGLGIQGLDVNKSPKSLAAEKVDTQPPASTNPSRPNNPQDDELYFGGLLDANEFAGEGDGSTFDESLFDLEDTDQYGRPIPGAFAAAQAARALDREEGKRTSDSTSRLSGQSDVSQSTAHTSFSGGPQLFPSALGTKRESEVLSPGRVVSVAPLGPSTAPELGSMAAYQAALAEAAHRAAADGKFRRDSSPPPSELVSPSVGQSSSLNDDSHLSSYDDYPDDDDFGYDNMDDYDFDDDAIIAEANADALASDSDGWYGSEFGFYSNGGPQPRHSKDNSGSDKTFEYANGGFFGPSGVSRTKSGRVVSREPNLTPITERSEYSNRNSIMSLAVPPIGSGPSSLASPGLAQLAMMYDDDNMNLSALMRLRSRAWGGSQLSLSSSREGSPRSERGDGASSPWGERGNLLGVHGHARKNSAFSVRSRDFDSSEAGSASGSPTLTMSMPVIASPPPPVLPINTSSSLGTSASATSLAGPAVFEAIHETDEQPDTNVSSMSSSGVWTKSPDAMAHPNLTQSFSNSSRTRRPGMGHKHKGSADSISYVQEEEESGETRWVMERRYTADTGEVEVEREVLQQGRI
jgi:hypothetical protein